MLVVCPGQRAQDSAGVTRLGHMASPFHHGLLKYVRLKKRIYEVGALATFQKPGYGDYRPRSNTHSGRIHRSLVHFQLLLFPTSPRIYIQVYVIFSKFALAILQEPGCMGGHSLQGGTFSGHLDQPVIPPSLAYIHTRLLFSTALNRWSWLSLALISWLGGTP